MPATLSSVLRTLRDHEDDLRRRGVRHADGDREYTRLKLYVGGLLDGAGDVVNRKTLKPLLRDAILREAVNAF